MSESPGFAGCHSARTGQGSRSSHFYYPGCLSSPPTLPPLTGMQKQSSGVKSYVRTPLQVDHTGQRGAGVVERQSRCLEWKSPGFREFRCIYPGLEQGEGICLPSICSSGQMPQETIRPECPFLVLIAPLWQSQPWYPLLLQSCIAAPILLPHYQGLLTRQMEMHPLDNLQLAGWLLSANHTLKQAFHNQLKNCCWQHGAKAQQLPMLPLGESGIAGVVSGKLVQCMPQ